MKYFIILIGLFIVAACSSSSDFYSENTIAENRAKFEQQLVNRIETDIKTEITDSNIDKFESTFWAMELMNYRSAATDSVMSAAFNNFNSLSSQLQRAFLEVVYTLYPSEYQQQIYDLLPKLSNPKNFAMAANYLLRNDSYFSYCEKYLNQFDSRNDNPILISLAKNIERLKSGKSISAPPIKDLIYHKLNGDYFYIYSFQRKNRDYRGITIVKNQYNKFIRNDDGSIFHIKHFARSITNLPGYLTNGNTPQGVLSFHGFANSKNVFIGPTTNLQLGLPYEFSAKSFLNDENESSEWSLNLYNKLLPKSWISYSPVHEAFYAGMAGRTEIIAHGSTINPEFYSNKIYYPYTPSQGCMTAFEKWSATDGKLLESDQLKLFEAVSRTNSSKGFMYVIEIDDKNVDVSFSEIKAFLDESF